MHLTIATIKRRKYFFLIFLSMLTFLFYYATAQSLIIIKLQL